MKNFHFYLNRLAQLILGIAISYCGLLAPTVLANSNNDKQQTQLKAIDKKIVNVQGDLRHKVTQRSQLQTELKQTEISYNKIAANYQRTEQQLALSQQKLQAVFKHSQNDQALLTRQQDLLAEQLRAAYTLGKPSYLKLILNQEDANQLSRMLSYYQYITQNRTNSIHELEITLDTLKSDQEIIKQQQSRLHQLQSTQQQQRKELAELKHKRTQLVTALNQSIISKNRQLKALQANKQALEQTIAHLKQQTAKTPFHYQNFAKLQGHLHWPTKGKILNYFGSPIADSQLKWSGILIDAPENRDIHAVANGKVVFAKQLPGYGLLLIIDHGKGYMTLYGRNHALYKKQGDNVRTGETIASVGHSGGYDQAALYFAIRHNAIPLNPVKWCK